MDDGNMVRLTFLAKSARMTDHLKRLTDTYGGAWAVRVPNGGEYATRVWIPSATIADFDGTQFLPLQDRGDVEQSLYLAARAWQAEAADDRDAVHPTLSMKHAIPVLFTGGEPLPGVVMPAEAGAPGAERGVAEAFALVQNATASLLAGVAAVWSKLCGPEHSQRVKVDPATGTIHPNGTVAGLLKLMSAAETFQSRYLSVKPPRAAVRLAAPIGAAGKIRFIVCFDGTKNEEGSGTNVYRIFNAATAGLQGDGVCQVPIYVQGVDLDANPHFANGAEVPVRMQQAYTAVASLMRGRDPRDVEIFVFGFSRGAYTALLFTEVLRVLGLPRRGMDSTPMDWAEMLANFRSRTEAEVKRLCDQARGGAADMQFVPKRVRFLGLWDTVSQVTDFCMGGWEFSTEKHPPYADVFVHAMALDERRASFPLHAICTDATDAKHALHHVWFAGTHADIGGYTYKPEDAEYYGVPSGDVAVSNMTLVWMQAHAHEAGLVFSTPLALDVEGWRAATTRPLFDSYGAFFDPRPKSTGPLDSQTARAIGLPSIKDARWSDGSKYGIFEQGRRCVLEKHGRHVSVRARLSSDVPLARAGEPAYHYAYTMAELGHLREDTTGICADALKLL